MLKKIFLIPYFQGIFIVGLMIIFLVIFKVFKKPIAGWNSSALLIILFCTINAIIGIFDQSILIYLIKSIITFICLFIAAFLLSTLITGVNYEGIKENAMIFLGPILYYPFLLLIMGLIRLIKNMFQ